jgi:membrane protease YdiL (CAAX protease family)
MSSAPPPGSWPPPSAAVELPHAPPPDELPPWPAWTAPAALLTAFALAVVGGLVIAIVSSAFGASLQHPGAAVNIAATIVQDVAFVGAALYYASRAAPLAAAQFGLRRTSLSSALRWIALAILAYYVFGRVWDALVHVDAKDDRPLKALGADKGTAALVAVCVLVTVIAPIAEEVLFRGYCFTALRSWRGPWLAAVLTGLVFGAIHAGSTPAAFLVPLAVLGFLLCVLRWRTESLLPCIAVHALNNAAAFGVTEGWSAGHTSLLVIAAVAVTLLATVPFVGWPARPAAAHG